MVPVKKFLASVIPALLIAGCNPIVDARGHGGEAMDFKQIIVGQSRTDDVQAILGSPSTRSSFGEETWYYISEKKETLGLYAPEVTDQKVVAVRFDADHVVTAVDDFTKDQAKQVEIVSKTTPTEGRTLGMMEQLLGNVGRFGAPGQSSLQRNMGGGSRP